MSSKHDDAIVKLGTRVSPPEKFVVTHGHSTFSAGDGLGFPQQHIDYALENGMDAYCLTDHGNMNGFCHAYLHAKELREQGHVMKFVPGVEAYLHPDLPWPWLFGRALRQRLRVRLFDGSLGCRQAARGVGSAI